MQRYSGFVAAHRQRKRGLFEGADVSIAGRKSTRTIPGRAKKEPIGRTVSMPRMTIGTIGTPVVAGKKGILDDKLKDVLKQPEPGGSAEYEQTTVEELGLMMAGERQSVN